MCSGGVWMWNVWVWVWSWWLIVMASCEGDFGDFGDFEGWVGVVFFFFACALMFCFPFDFF